jgi:ABC-type Fe3+ transport system substrate-binding protein
MEFLLSDAAQERIVADGLYSPRLDYASPKGAPKLVDIKTIPIDHDQVAKNTKAIRQKFNEIFQ